MEGGTLRRVNGNPGLAVTAVIVNQKFFEWFDREHRSSKKPRLRRGRKKELDLERLAL